MWRSWFLEASSWIIWDKIGWQDNATRCSDQQLVNNGFKFEQHWTSPEGTCLSLVDLPSPGVPNPWSTDRGWSVAHWKPGHAKQQVSTGSSICTSGRCRCKIIPFPLHHCSYWLMEPERCGLALALKLLLDRKEEAMAPWLADAPVALADAPVFDNTYSYPNNPIFRLLIWCNWGCP